LRLNICAYRSALEARMFRCWPVCNATHLIIRRINSLLAVCPSTQSKAMQCVRTLGFTTTCAWICWPSICREYLKYVDDGQESVSPPTKAGKKPHFDICSQKRNFQGTAPTFARPQSFRFLSLGIFTFPVHSARNWHIPNPFLMPVKPFMNARPFLNACDCHWSDVLMCVLLQGKDFSSICCGLWLYIQKEP